MLPWVSCKIQSIVEAFFLYFFRLIPSPERYTIRRYDVSLAPNISIKITSTSSRSAWIHPTSTKVSRCVSLSDDAGGRLSSCAVSHHLVIIFHRIMKEYQRGKGPLLEQLWNISSPHTYRSRSLPTHSSSSGTRNHPAGPSYNRLFVCFSGMYVPLHSSGNSLNITSAPQS